jgi:hypothetical protein
MKADPILHFLNVFWTKNLAQNKKIVKIFTQLDFLYKPTQSIPYSISLLAVVYLAVARLL